MEILNTPLTKHCEIDRKQRVEEIVKNIGIGQIVKETYIRGFNKIEANQQGAYVCITDTGITIVKDETHTKIITMYVTSFKELVIAFKGVNNIPKYLRKKVDQNQVKYIKKGKTIWR